MVSLGATAGGGEHALRAFTELVVLETFTVPSASPWKAHTGTSRIAQTAVPVLPPPAIGTTAATRPGFARA